MQITDKEGTQRYSFTNRLLSFIQINRKKCYIFLLTILLISLFFISFTLGEYHVPFGDLVNMFYAKMFGLKETWPKTLDLVVFRIRMPRIIAAVLVGSVLALSGTTFQGIFKNPLVAPDILGASAGAGFGAALAIFLKFSLVYVQLTAFVFGMLAVAITYAISKAVGNGTNITLVLILAGMVIAQFFTALVSLIQYLADPSNALQQEIVFWLMGGLGTLTMQDILIASIPMLVGVILIILLRWKLNVLSFGDEEAEAMGINSKILRLILIIITTMITSASVAIGGIISWIGLIIPNIARLIFGSNFKILIPASILMGGIFLLIVDDVARSAFELDIPIGILTALIGGPMFAFILLKEKNNVI